MNATQQKLYDLALDLAYSMSKGDHINTLSARAKAFIDAAIATASTDLSGKTLRQAAESVT